MPKKHVDVLLFVEHVARELDVACAVKYLACARYNLNVEIASTVFDIDRTLKIFKPEIVAVPYCIGIISSPIDQLLREWPDAVYVNLAYEQLFREHQLAAKAPKDDLARSHLLYVSWGKFNSDFLITNGVDSRNIADIGNPVYALYRGANSHYFESRATLAKRFGLDDAKRWVFIPENYGAAFGTDRTVRSPAAGGGKIASEVREFALRSFNEAACWWSKLAESQEIELIVRPRPATALSNFTQALREVAGTIPERLRVIKDGTIREWILASDAVFSSYSTSLIEGAIAGKPVHMLAPVAFPIHLNTEWHSMVPSVTTFEQFAGSAIDSRAQLAGAELGTWAENVMMAKEDAILGLTKYLSSIRTGDTHIPQKVPSEMIRGFDHNNNGVQRPSGGLAGQVRGIAARVYRTVRGSGPSDHESDKFSDEDVHERVTRWSEVLG